MANRLFLMGNVLANSMENGDYPVSCPCFLKYAHDFEVGSHDALFRYPEGYEAKWPEAKRKRTEKLIDLGVKFRLIADGRKWGGACIVDTEQHWKEETSHYTLTDEDFVQKRRQYSNVCLIGFRARDKHALFRQRDRVVHFLRPRQDYRVKVQDFISNLNKRGPLIGVHIRLGDYRTWQGGKFAYGFDQYKSFMEQIEAFLGTKAHFLVASNEAIPEGAFGNLSFSLAPNHPMLDLFTLAECDLILGAPSTYSSWAAMQKNTPIHFVHDPTIPISESDFKPPEWETTP